MYSLSRRLNTIIFNTLVTYSILSAFNYATAFVEQKDLLAYISPSLSKGLQVPTIHKFNVKDVETFVKDEYVGEDAISFIFEMDVDLEKVFNWNTQMIFLYISCEFNTTKSQKNQVTIWD